MRTMEENVTMTSFGEEMAQESTKQETDRKCPQCGGVMDFDPQTGGLRCPYCDYMEEIPVKSEQEEGPAPELDYQSALQKENCDWGAAKKVIICKSCGAEAIYDELQIAEECPYCGSNQVMEEKNEQTMAPGGVVPFKISAKEAASKFTSWIKSKLFCPRAAKESAKPGSFKGVYLPYWTFDAHTVSRYEGAYGIDRTVNEGKEDERTVTDWYRTRGTYTDDFDDELVLASTRYEQSLLSSVEPFNTEDNKAYKPEYVAGFIAERYSVGLRDAFSKAKEFIRTKLESRIKSRIIREHRADHARVEKIETRYFDVTYKYLLLPVWLSTYRYNNKVYHFMVNGQTGKAGGQTPTSWLRVVCALLLLFVIAFGLADYGAAAAVCAVAAVIAAVVCWFTKM